MVDQAFSEVRARIKSLNALLKEVRACKLCSACLPHGPRPVFRCRASARILIASQAPGRKVHQTGLPFNDASGDRLRYWLGISREVFYDEQIIAIVPMGFCYPGTGSSGDLPPRKECAPAWRPQLLSHLKHLELTLVIGKYALDYHLPGHSSSVTAVVRAWQQHWPTVVPLPHPSPRNNGWLTQNPWFEAELVPALRLRVAEVLR